MIYTVEWLEIVQTRTGKTKANANLVDSNSIKTDNVAIWSDYPGFQDIRPGSKVDGDLVVKNIKGKNYTSLYPAKNANNTYRPTPRQTPIEKAVEAKNQSMGQFQDKKMEGIKDSSTFRAATDHVIQWRAERLARGENTTTEQWQVEWINVRKWFDSKFSEPFN